MPSTEEVDPQDRIEPQASTTTAHMPRLLTTPLVLMTTSPSQTNPRQSDRATGSSSDSAGGVHLGTADRDSRLASPQSTTFGMSDVAAAIQQVAAGSDNPVFLEPGSAERVRAERARDSRRRQSSSRLSIGPHEVWDEEPPRDPFHEPAFQQAFREARGLVAELVEVLGSGVLHVDPDSTMRRLYREAETLARFRCSSTRTVGFVGDSGVGQSPPPPPPASPPFLRPTPPFACALHMVDVANMGTRQE